MTIFIRLAVASMLLLVVRAAPALEAGSAEGTLTVNGETIELNHAYVYRKAEGFYDPADPTWEILFSARKGVGSNFREKGSDPISARFCSAPNDS